MRWISFWEGMIEVAFFDVGDAAIYYESIGEGSPIVFLHGYALNGTMWEFQKPAVSAKFKMVTVDLRGFGQSSCSGRWSSDVMAEDVIGLIKDRNFPDCTIIGFSMSGPVAFKVALNNPDRVRKLVMVSSILPSAGEPRRRVVSKAERQELDDLILHGVDAWAEKMGLKDGPLIGNTFKRNPESRTVWRKMLSRHNPEFLRCMMEARENMPQSENWRKRLPEVKQPTLIIAGAQDDRFIDASKNLARVIPGARLVIISGAGHMVNMERPDEFNGVLMKFLEEKVTDIFPLD